MRVSLASKDREPLSNRRFKAQLRFQSSPQIDVVLGHEVQGNRRILIYHESDDVFVKKKFYDDLVVEHVDAESTQLMQEYLIDNVMDPKGGSRVAMPMPGRSINEKDGELEEEEEDGVDEGDEDEDDESADGVSLKIAPNMQPYLLVTEMDTPCVAVHGFGTTDDEGWVTLLDESDFDDGKAEEYIYYVFWPGVSRCIRLGAITNDETRRLVQRYIEFMENHSTVPKPAFELYPPQQKAVETILANFEPSSTRSKHGAALGSPPGTGKTAICVETVGRIGRKVSLVIAPGWIVARHFAREFEQLHPDWNVQLIEGSIEVCAQRIRAAVFPRFPFSSPSEFVPPVDEIKREHLPHVTLITTFTTYRLCSEAISRVPLDLIVVDEFHLAMMKRASKLYRALEDYLGKHPETFLLLSSATPWKDDASGFATFNLLLRDKPPREWRREELEALFKQFSKSNDDRDRARANFVKTFLATKTKGFNVLSDVETFSSALQHRVFPLGPDGLACGSLFEYLVSEERIATILEDELESYRTTKMPTVTRKAWLIEPSPSQVFLKQQLAIGSITHAEGEKKQVEVVQGKDRRKRERLVNFAADLDESGLFSVPSGAPPDAQLRHHRAHSPKVHALLRDLEHDIVAMEARFRDKETKGEAVAVYFSHRKVGMYLERVLGVFANVRQDGVPIRVHRLDGMSSMADKVVASKLMNAEVVDGSFNVLLISSGVGSSGVSLHFFRAEYDIEVESDPIVRKQKEYRLIRINSKHSAVKITSYFQNWTREPILCAQADAQRRSDTLLVGEFFTKYKADELVLLQEDPDRQRALDKRGAQWRQEIQTRSHERLEMLLTHSHSLEAARDITTRDHEFVQCEWPYDMQHIPPPDLEVPKHALTITAGNWFVHIPDFDPKQMRGDIAKFTSLDIPKKKTLLSRFGAALQPLLTELLHLPPKKGEHKMKIYESSKEAYYLIRSLQSEVKKDNALPESEKEDVDKQLKEWEKAVAHSELVRASYSVPIGAWTSAQNVQKLIAERSVLLATNKDERSQLQEKRIDVIQRSLEDQKKKIKDTEDKLEKKRVANEDKLRRAAIRREKKAEKDRLKEEREEGKKAKKEAAAKARKPARGKPNAASVAKSEEDDDEEDKEDNDGDGGEWSLNDSDRPNRDSHKASSSSVSSAFSSQAAETDLARRQGKAQGSRKRHRGLTLDQESSEGDIDLRPSKKPRKGKASKEKEKEEVSGSGVSDDNGSRDEPSSSHENKRAAGRPQKLRSARGIGTSASSEDGNDADSSISKEKRVIEISSDNDDNDDQRTDHSKKTRGPSSGTAASRKRKKEADESDEVSARSVSSPSAASSVSLQRRPTRAARRPNAQRATTTRQRVQPSSSEVHSDASSEDAPSEPPKKRRRRDPQTILAAIREEEASEIERKEKEEGRAALSPQHRPQHPHREEEKEEEEDLDVSVRSSPLPSKNLDDEGSW